MERWKGVFLFLVFLLGGCGPKAPHTIIADYMSPLRAYFERNPDPKAPNTIIADYGKTKTRLVALLPVDNRTNDQTAARIVRETMFEELYFKGYPKIPLKAMDEKLLKIYEGNLSKAGGNIPPKVIGELLGVDAVMYCTLNESKTSSLFFYAPTSASVLCELRSAKTGATLWQARHRAVKRNFGFSRRDLEVKTSQVYEAVIQEVVNKVIKTLPDGPDLLR